MRRREKADRIGEILDTLYPETPVPLDHQDPYTLLVAVALSAQTTDKKVNQITPALFAAANTPEQMAALGIDRIRELISEVGLGEAPSRRLQGRSHASPLVPQRHRLRGGDGDLVQHGSATGPRALSYAGRPLARGAWPSWLRR